MQIGFSFGHSVWQHTFFLTRRGQTVFEMDVVHFFFQLLHKEVAGGGIGMDGMGLFPSLLLLLLVLLFFLGLFLAGTFPS